MKKVALFLVVFLLLLLSACSSGVSQEQYNKATADITAAQSQVQSLQSQVQSQQTSKDAMTKKNAVASAYAEFFDVLMYPAWNQVGITPRFTYTSYTDWLADMNNRAISIGDNELSNYVQQLQQGGQTATTASYNLMNYCMSKIEGNLK